MFYGKCNVHYYANSCQVDNNDDYFAVLVSVYHFRLLYTV